MSGVSSGERIVRANGVDLCVESFGDPAHPAILLTHGIGSSMLSWDAELCDRLAAGGRFVVRYDSRDAGRSVAYEPGAPPYGLRDLAADAVALLDALGVAHVHHVGMSGGASLGQLLALEHPDRIASVTLASTAPGIPGEESDGLPGAAEPLRAYFADPPSEPDWRDRAAVVEYMVAGERPFAARSRPFDEAAVRELCGRVYDRAANIASNLTNPYLADPGAGWRARLGAIRGPALVVHGAEDPLFPVEYGRALADEIPGASLLVLPGVGHEHFPRVSWDRVVPALLEHTRR
jgi:pimeloyl-ACP methyl ester carboxylesterase